MKQTEHSFDNTERGRLLFSPGMKLADLVESNYELLVVLARMGIPLGFGEASVGEVCRQRGISAELFLMICRIYSSEVPVLPYEQLTSDDLGGVLDTRYSEIEVVSHDRNSIMSTPVDSSSSILLLSSDIDVVGIDEAQFFDDGLVAVCNELANKGIRVIVAGLDMDFKGVPFGPIPALCAIADEVTKVHAICVRCGALAYVSHRLVNNEKRVMLGEQAEYEPLCRECYRKALEEDKNKDKTH